MSGVWGETILRSELPGNDTAGLTFPLLLNLNTGPVTSLSKKEKERGPGKMNRRFQGGKGMWQGCSPIQTCLTDSTLDRRSKTNSEKVKVNNKMGG